MWAWALKTLWQERRAASVSGLGVALAMLLVLYLDAVFRGEADQVVAFIEQTPGEIWVLQSGIENLHMTRSRLSEQTVADVDWIVRRAGGQLVPLVYRDALVGPDGARRLAYVVGVNEQAGITAWRLVAGEPMPKAGQAVVPAPLAAQLGLQLGNTITVGAGIFTISGLSSETFSMANPLVFLHEQDARDILDVSDGASLAIVRGVSNRAELMTAIRGANDDVEVLSRAELLASDYRIALEMAGELLQLMGLIGMIVSALVVSFSTYAFVAQREAELAMARAVGSPISGVFSAVLLMGLSLALVGVALSAALIPAIDFILSRFVPEVAVHFSFNTFAMLAASILLVALLAALIPAWRVARVDPSLVFQG